MIRAYTLQEGRLTQHKHPALHELEGLPNLIWLDLQSPSQEEKEFVEKLYKIEFFTSQEAQEIESSSRFLETDDTIEMNLSLLQNGASELSIANASFILKGNTLFTFRQGDLKSFAETVRRLKAGGSLEKKEHGLGVFLTILEVRIDMDADLIEGIHRRLNQISKDLIASKSYQEELLLSIAREQENTMLIHQTITEKQRVVSSLLRIGEFTPLQVERLKVIVKDVASLLQHAEFSSERLEYMQNTFLGLVNIEQNTVIKIFTVVTVVFMPPTLIASIYGMNFQHMPELDWLGGYPFAIALMLISSLAFLWYFKRKKWL